jgi:uncharacterized protein YbbC (DUF1343 family)
MKRSFQPGIETLLTERKDWLAGGRVGLVTHLAAVDRRGRTSAERLRKHPDIRLVALFAPEHGFFGKAGAGERCRTIRHPDWSIPIHSLYGAARQPTPAMLRGIDVLVFDLQDLGVRCYTYVSTLRLVLEAAARAGIPVVIADRPVPLANVTDGPLLSPKFSSFVGLVPSPLVYGMTPGETALWLKDRLELDVDVKVATLRGYARQPQPGRNWPPWVPPSPAIRSWACGLCYPATVCFEALPSIDFGRGTPLAFQIFASPWIKAAAAAEFLSGQDLPGVRFRTRRYAPRPALGIPPSATGVLLDVTIPGQFRPALTAVAIVSALQRLAGKDRLWKHPSTRPEFFDKLFGTDSVRKALLDGEDCRTIASRWVPDLAAFGRERRHHLLYGPGASARC